MKTFNYKNYKNCYFYVTNYLADKNAMAISIQNDEEGDIAFCTIYDVLSVYSPDLVTIKNYSENSYMTNFLEDLGVVISIIDRRPCNQFVRDTINTDNPQTIDTCIVDTDILKEYCKKWKYNV